MIPTHSSYHTLHTNASNTQVLQGYISNRWIDILKQQFDLADKVQTTTKSCSSDSDTKKRPLVKTDNNTPSVKRSRTSDLDDALEFIVGSSGNKKGNKNQQTANKVKSLAQRRLAKTNTKGMKSMFSFFKKERIQNYLLLNFSNNSPTSFCV